MYVCIYHDFNYYLPDFVTAIFLGFIFGFPFPIGMGNTLEWVY